MYSSFFWFHLRRTSCDNGLQSLVYLTILASLHNSSKIGSLKAFTEILNGELCTESLCHNAYDGRRPNDQQPLTCITSSLSNTCACHKLSLTFEPTFDITNFFRKFYIHQELHLKWSLDGEQGTRKSQHLVIQFLIVSLKLGSYNTYDGTQKP